MSSIFPDFSTATPFVELGKALRPELLLGGAGAVFCDPSWSSAPGTSIRTDSSPPGVFSLRLERLCAGSSATFSPARAGFSFSFLEGLRPEGASDGDSSFEAGWALLSGAAAELATLGAGFRILEDLRAAASAMTDLSWRCKLLVTSPRTPLKWRRVFGEKRFSRSSRRVVTRIMLLDCFSLLSE